MANTAESPQLIQELTTILRSHQPDYRFEPLDDYSELGDKSMIGIIGPTGVGKTTLTDRVTQLDPEIRPINTTTTRERKPEDPEDFKTANEGITFSYMNELRIKRQLVNYSVNDNGHVYGTLPEDFTGEYNIGPILSDSIDNLLTAGFKHFTPLFVVARGGLYRQRLEQQRVQYSDIRKRLVEGLGSIAWARMNAQSMWLSFIDTGEDETSLTEAARNVIRMNYQGTGANMTSQHALTLLDEMEDAIRTVGAKLG